MFLFIGKMLTKGLGDIGMHDIVLYPLKDVVRSRSVFWFNQQQPLIARLEVDGQTLGQYAAGPDCL